MIWRLHYYTVPGFEGLSTHEVRGCSTKKEAIAQMDAELGEKVLISHVEVFTGDTTDDTGLGGF